MRKNRVSFGVIGTSVLSSRVEGVWDFILPHEILQPVRSEVNPVLKVTSFDIVGSIPYQRRWLLSYIIEDLLRRGGVSVVVVDKACLLEMVKRLKLKYNVEVVGDLDRRVVDYVVVRGDGEVYLMYHGRISMGVDPPVLEVDRVYVVGGVRRPERWRVPVGAVDVLYMVRERFLDIYGWYRKAFKRKGFSLLLRDEFRPGSVRVYRDRLEVYDVWDYWYDAHILRQVIGR